MATVILRMSEKEFWRCTLKKLYALWNVHKQVNGLEVRENKKDDRAYIDQIL